MKREVTATQDVGRTQVALLMLRWQARTHTIMAATHLSEDQVRRLYRQYCRGQVAQRQRGRSPSTSATFLRTLPMRYEASLWAGVLLTHGLLVGRRPKSWAGKPLLYAEQFCRAYEEYCSLALHPPLSFEHAWYFARNLATLTGVSLRRCGDCASHFVHDDADVRRQACPLCKQREQWQVRQQIKQAG